MEVVEKTLKATTQLAHSYLRLPMRRHFESRFSQLNVNRLRENMLLIHGSLQYHH